MEELTEVITAAEFHPQSCNIFAYSSSKGTIKLNDMRDSALCDNHSKGMRRLFPIFPKFSKKRKTRQTSPFSRKLSAPSLTWSSARMENTFCRGITSPSRFGILPWKASLSRLSRFMNICAPSFVTCMRMIVFLTSLSVLLAVPEGIQSTLYYL